MCEFASRSRKPQVASLFLPATAFFLIYNSLFIYLFIYVCMCVFIYLFIYVFIYLVFGVFNLTLTFSSVNAAIDRGNTSFRFSFVREIPRKQFPSSVEGQFIVSDMNEILSFPRKFLYENVDYVKLTNIQIYTGKRSSEANFR